MNPSIVFDTGALTLFCAEDERLRELVDKSDEQGATQFVSAVTIGEFYYKTCQTLGRETASVWSKQISERMEIVSVDADTSLSAGLEKCRNNRLSLADCYALTLAKQVRGLLLTTDSELAKSKETSVRLFQVGASSKV